MKRFSKTIRGCRNKNDVVHVVADVDPLDKPLDHKADIFVYVTSRNLADGTNEAHVAMLTPKKALALAAALTAAARHGGAK